MIDKVERARQKKQNMMHSKKQMRKEQQMKALKEREHTGRVDTDPPAFSDTELRTNRRLV